MSGNTRPRWRLTRRIAGCITRDGRGQSLVEVALVLPVLLVLFAGALDLGRAFYANISVANAARAGALQAARTPVSYQAGTECPVAANSSTAALTAAYTARQSNLITCAVQDEARAVVTVPATGITYGCEDGSGATQPCATNPTVGLRSRVTVSTTMQLATPVLLAIFPSGSLTIGSSAAADQLALPAPVSPAGSSAPTPTPTPTPTATATPTPTPTPEPTLPPGQCVVPNLDNLSKASAQQTWANFGLTRQNLSYVGSNSGFVVAGSQTITAGLVVPCSTSIMTVTLR